MKSYYKILDIVKIKSGDVVIDCGANVGYITNILYKAGAILYAFEPNTYAFSALSKMFKGVKEVTCYNKAVMGAAGKVKLYMHKWDKENHLKWSVGSSVFESKENVDFNNFKEIDAICLSDFIKMLNVNIKLVKMNVEGAECEILTDLIDTGVIHNIDIVLVEAHFGTPQVRTNIRELKERIN